MHVVGHVSDLHHLAHVDDDGVLRLTVVRVHVEDVVLEAFDAARLHALAHPLALQAAVRLGGRLCAAARTPARREHVLLCLSELRTAYERSGASDRDLERLDADLAAIPAAADG